MKDITHGISIFIKYNSEQLHGMSKIQKNRSLVVTMAAILKQLNFCLSKTSEFDMTMSDGIWLLVKVVWNEKNMLLLMY